MATAGAQKHSAVSNCQKPWNSKSELWTLISEDIIGQENTKAAGIAVFISISLTAANKRLAFVVVYIAAKLTCRDQNGIFQVWQKIFEDQ